MTFQPGVASNPAGHPKGARNKRTEEIWSRLEARGDLDPADVLSEIVSDKTLAKELRATAANYLLPYKYGIGVIPVVRSIPEQIEVPNFTSIDQGEEFLNDISVRLGRGEIDSQSALELGSLTKQWINSRRAGEELQRKITAQGGGFEQHITISGGLPSLPGFNIIGRNANRKNLSTSCPKNGATKNRSHHRQWKTPRPAIHPRPLRRKTRTQAGSFCGKFLNFVCQSRPG